MYFTTAAVSAFLLSAGAASAFSPSPSASFVASRVSNGAAPTVSFVAPHASGCGCAPCAGRRSIALFSTAEAESEAADVPAEVDAMDGIESDVEAHNSERPARKSLKKKSPDFKPLSELVVGETIRAKVKSIMSYGAFMDIGAESDGLLHISQLASGFVADVKDVLELGKEYDVRIVSVDEKKNQVSLSLLKNEKAEASESDAPQSSRPREQSSGRRDNREQSGGRRDNSAPFALLAEKGWDSTKFVTGTVVNTLDYGAFVRVDLSQLNSEVQGEVEGLLHISALKAGRVNAVTDVINVNDKVQVRLKEISSGRASLSMVSPEDEKTKKRGSDSAGGSEFDKNPSENMNWKEDLAKVRSDMPVFRNKPMVVSTRK